MPMPSKWIKWYFRSLYCLAWHRIVCASRLSILLILVCSVLFMSNGTACCCYGKSQHCNIERQQQQQQHRIVLKVHTYVLLSRKRHFDSTIRYDTIQFNDYVYSFLFIFFLFSLCSSDSIAFGFGFGICFPFITFYCC